VKLDRAGADTTYKISFAAFVLRAGIVMMGQSLTPNWHIDAICWEIQRLYMGRRRPRLIVNLPPRSLKSFIVTICLPAWLLGHYPSLAIVAVSYSDELARKFSRDCRALMETQFYKRLFPRTRLNPRKISETEFETTRRGSRMATSVGGTLTGRGADLLIIDDPMKGQDAYSELVRNSTTDWFNGTAMSRLNEPARSKVIVVMQRLHADDLAGYLIEKNWRALVLPAIATKTKRYAIGPRKSYLRRSDELLQRKRDSRDILDEIRCDRGSHVFAAQYQQDPVPPDGNLIKADWLKRYDPVDDPNQFERIILTCDPAGKAGPRSDYTAMVVAGMMKNRLHILEVVRGHWNILQMRDRILTLAASRRTDEVLVEDTASGMGLIDILRAESRLSVLGMHPKDNKVTRLQRHQAKFECGQLWLPKEAPWCAEFERELLAFPNGKYDDQVDALLLLLDWYTENRDYLAGISGIQLVSIPRDETWGDPFGWRSNLD
jgi:predicted phage terminase large subunit-like protein